MERRDAVGGRHGWQPVSSGALFSRWSRSVRNSASLGFVSNRRGVSKRFNQWMAMENPVVTSLGKGKEVTKNPKSQSKSLDGRGAGQSEIGKRTVGHRDVLRERTRANRSLRSWVTVQYRYGEARRNPLQSTAPSRFAWDSIGLKSLVGAWPLPNSIEQLSYMSRRPGSLS